METIHTYSQSEVYQLKCNKRTLKFIRQKGHTFQVRYKERIHAVRTNEQKSICARHIIDTGQTYSTIDQTLEILHMKRKAYC